MISQIKMGDTYITPTYEIVGLSIDTKPTDVPNGSVFFEMNTKKKYMFDEEHANWVNITT